MFTLKISTLYLLPSSRKLIVNTLLKHVEIVKFHATNTNDMSLDSSLKTKFTLKISVLYLLPLPRN